MFETKKMLQVIAYLLSLNNGRMNLLKLMKELYLIDRESIKERDASVSGDVYFSLPHGPILSATLNLLNDIKMDKKNPFAEFLERAEAKYYFDVVLKTTPEYDHLSEKDIEYIEKISEKFKSYTPKRMENYTHSLPEWVNPNGSSIKIRFQDIMRALGKNEEEILIAKQEYEQMSNLTAYLDTARGL
jgi:hypothetical protein